MSIRKTELINKILGRAVADSFLSSDPIEHQIKRTLDKGEEIPDHCLPGRIIMKLSEEEREILKTCTAKDFNHRI